MKKLWNKLKPMPLGEFADKFKPGEVKLEQWHKEAISKYSAFIAEGGTLTFRKGRKK